MISTVNILCLTAIVSTLVFIFSIILSFHEGDEAVKLDIREEGKGGHAKEQLR